MTPSPPGEENTSALEVFLPTYCVMRIELLLDQATAATPR